MSGRRSLLAGCVAVVWFLPLARVELCGQAPKAGPVPAPAPHAFDVVAIHSADTLSTSENLNYGRGRLSGKGVSLAFLLTTALGVQPFQVEGLPASLAGKRFNFEARLDDPAEDPAPDATADAGQANRALANIRLLSMLQDRFGLRFHVEPRRATVFALAVAAHGPHLQPSTTPRQFIHAHTTSQGTVLEIAGQTMTAVAATLAYRMGMQVVDRTGLSGPYDLTVEFASPDSPAEQEQGSSFPSLVTALPEQVGLMLRREKGQVPVYRIDRIEDPTQN